MMEMLLFGLVSALVVILLVPAEVQGRIRRASVRCLRFVASMATDAANAAERAGTAPAPKGSLREVPNPDVERVSDTERLYVLLSERVRILGEEVRYMNDAARRNAESIRGVERRLSGFIADYVGDMGRVGDAINNLKGIDVDTGQIDIRDQASNLRSMVDESK